MLDRLVDLEKMAKDEKVYMTLDDEEIGQEKLDKDRELIADFLEYTKKA